jgi:hypothetical protein
MLNQSSLEEGGVKQQVLHRELWEGGVKNKISIVDNDVISLWVYPDRQMIHHQMKTYCYGDKFREALTRGTDAMNQYKATKWLSDDRGNGALLPEDTDWAEKVWFPRTKAIGWQHWSVVKPEKVIGQINLSRFVKKFAQLGINARIFSDLGEAFTWIDAER